MKRLFLIMGMHRSGTSACTKVMNIAGIELGDKLMQAHADNAKGFFEDLDAVIINDAILNGQHASWKTPNRLDLDHMPEALRATHVARIEQFLNDRFAQTDTYGLKDPRLCRTLPLWQTAFRNLDIEPYYIVIFRHPMEIVGSLKKRNGFGDARSLNMWTSYNLDIQAYTEGENRVVVSYQDLMEDPRGVVDSVISELSLDLEITPDKEEAIAGFLDRGLRHSQFDEQDLERLQGFPEVRALYAMLQNGLTDYDETPFATWRERHKRNQPRAALIVFLKWLKLDVLLRAAKRFVRLFIKNK